MKHIITIALILALSTGLIACGDQKAGQMGVFFNPNAIDRELPQVPPELKNLYIFATTTKYTGYLGTREQIDEYCNLPANKPAALEDYSAYAFISKNGTDQMKDLAGKYGFATDEAIYAAATNHKIADDWADLFDGTLDMSLQEAGQMAANENYWTGSTDDGSVSSETCNEWTDDDGAGAFLGTNGSSSLKNGAWLINRDSKCDQLLKILCIAVK
jgi:hypothetical protein